jgi:Thioredoxin-like
MRKILIRIALCAGCTGLILHDGRMVRSQQTTQAPSRAKTDEETIVLGLMSKLGDIGQHLKGATDSQAIVQYNLQQADIILQILAHTSGRERLAWFTQLVDCLHVAALNSVPADQSSYKKLVELETQFAKEIPGSSLAAYATNCEMQVEHLIHLSQPNADFIKTQEYWRQRLVTFIQTYPSAKETPENLMELAMVSESLNRNMDAKRSYGYLAEHFPNHELAARARGAIRRLQVEGQTFSLALPLLYTEDRRYDVPFDIDEFRGKLTVVYFWSSHESQSLEDLNALKVVMERFHGRGLELLCVNLDNSPEEARRFLRGSHTAGIDVFQRGGVNGVAALRYGLVALPTTLLIGKDGKVISRDVQIGTLDRLVTRHLTDPVRAEEVKPAAYIGQHWPWNR